MFMALLAIGLVIGLSLTAKRSASGHHVGDARCLLPPEKQDIFAHCACHNTTEGFRLTADEEDYYHESQVFALENGFIADIIPFSSCSFENQCLINGANFIRRNGNIETVRTSLKNEEYAIQFYTLCLTYLNLDGPHWGRNDGWMYTDKVCDWFGISCTFLERVTGLDLSSNGLDGTLPSELRHMPFMRELDLSHNQGLTGTIPSELSEASSLQSFDLSHTSMNGTLPTELGSMERFLDRIVLTNSSFSGTIPVELSNLSRMKELYLDHNSFRGTLYADLGKMTSLEKLFLNHNHFSGSLQSEFAAWRNVDTVFLHNNNFSGTIPSEYGSNGWSNLVEINLSHNGFAGSFPSFLGDFQYIGRMFPLPSHLTANAVFGTLTNFILYCSRNSGAQDTAHWYYTGSILQLVQGKQSQSRSRLQRDTRPGLQLL
jgi:hypothetical protein